jgi:cytochrome c-type biogenesis protein CcmH
MTLWFVFALMTAAAVFAVLWPLSRQGVRKAGSDVAVYRDQLAEIGRDRAAGLIEATEAEAARVEVSRRLIAAADAEQASASPEASVVDAGARRRRRVAAVAALVVVPVVAALIYVRLGSPSLPGEPLTARMHDPHQNQSVESLVAQVEARIERNPNDGRGWEVIAPVYLRMGRFDDAVRARRNSLRLNGETADREADLGEALVAAGNGVVTDDAKSAFERALALDPQHLKSQFFTGLAAEQDGHPDKAKSIWQAMLDKAPAGAPWSAMVRQALASLDKPGQAGQAQAQMQASATPNPTVPGPTTDDMKAAAGMNAADREAMIRGMVDRLATRLAQNGQDVDGWLRLMRAYSVLGDRNKARGATAVARKAMAGNDSNLRRINDLAKELGLDS